MSWRGGHASVRIERTEYLSLRDYFLELACRRHPESIADEFAALPYARFAPVRQDIARIIRAVNRKRKAASYQEIRLDDAIFRRIPVRPFERCMYESGANTAESLRDAVPPGC